MESKNYIDDAVKIISKLPSLGKRSATRITLKLISEKEHTLTSLIQVLAELKENIKICKNCGNYDTEEICEICRDQARDKKVICVLPDVSSLIAMERTGYYNGLYHITGGLISALDGIEPEDLKIQSLIERCSNGEIEEIIFALPSIIEGKITQNYIKEKLPSNIRTSELAQGIPIGGELDYLDEGTISEALRGRKNF
ncbi:MAG: recombination mediator RecR [Alphaproteobacteria bacterium]|jgi:recombination protein RecR|nr:recombination mediator RecR [Alphaproteobacteria bacterium]